MLLETPAKEVLTGYDLFERVVRTLRLLWPLALLTWIPGVSILGRAAFPPLEREYLPDDEPIGLSREKETAAHVKPKA